MCFTGKSLLTAGKKSETAAAVQSEAQLKDDLEQIDASGEALRTKMLAEVEKAVCSEGVGGLVTLKESWERSEEQRQEEYASQARLVKSELAALVAKEEAALDKKLRRRRNARMKLLDDGNASSEQRTKALAQLDAVEAVAKADLKSAQDALQARIEAEIALGPERPVDDLFSAEDILGWKNLSDDEQKALMAQEESILEGHMENHLLLEAATRLAEKKAAALKAKAAGVDVDSDPAPAGLDALGADALESNLEVLKAEQEGEMLKLREMVTSNVDRDKVRLEERLAKRRRKAVSEQAGSSSSSVEAEADLDEFEKEAREALAQKEATIASQVGHHHRHPHHHHRDHPHHYYFHYYHHPHHYHPHHARSTIQRSSGSSRSKLCARRRRRRRASRSCRSVKFHPLYSILCIPSFRIFHSICYITNVM
jgi:hypothetical protein